MNFCWQTIIKKKILLGVCKQSTMVLKVQPYLLSFFNSAKSGASLDLCGYFSAIWGYLFWVWVILRTILKPTYIDNQLCFWRYSTIFLFLVWQNFGIFCTLWPSRIFWGLGSGSKTFLIALT